LVNQGRTRLKSTLIASKTKPIASHQLKHSQSKPVIKPKLKRINVKSGQQKRLKPWKSISIFKAPGGVRVKGQRIRQKYKQRNEHLERNSLGTPDDIILSPIIQSDLGLFSKTSRIVNASRKDHRRYADYLLKSWTDISKEAEQEKHSFTKSITDLRKLTSKEDMEMNRLLEDADSSMIQLFSERIEHLDDKLTTAEKFERLKEFKQDLKDDFRLSNLILENYINQEMKEEYYWGDWVWEVDS
jgi:SHS2 domain-containing protein